jgi:hypothetical protein
MMVPLPNCFLDLGQGHLQGFGFFAVGDDGFVVHEKSPLNQSAWPA